MYSDRQEEEKEKYEYNKLLNEMKELIRAKDKGTTAFEKKFNEMQKIANEEEKKDKAKNIKIKKQKNFKSFRKLLRGKREVSRENAFPFEVSSVQNRSIAQEYFWARKKA